MAAAAAPSWPPPPAPQRLRAKVLQPEDFDVDHIRSAARRGGRKESRRLLRKAMGETRALVLDLADGLEVDERGARAALQGRRPIDVGDVLAVGATGPGGLRLARRWLALVRDELDRIEQLTSHG